MDISILQDIGLSKSEIDLYLALLELGPSTSGPIINKTKLQSSVVHRAVKTLIDKGLVTFVKVGKNKQYQATDPKNILNYIDDKRKKLQDVLPYLELKQSLGKEKNETEMLLGKRAIFTMLNGIIKDSKKGEEYLSFSLIDAHDDSEIIRFYTHYNLRRREKGLKVKVLVNKKVKKIYEKNYTKELLKKAGVRYTSFTFPQGIVIHKNNVVFLTWSENTMAIKVTNSQMAEQFRSFFLGFYNAEKNAY